MITSYCNVLLTHPVTPYSEIRELVAVALTQCTGHRNCQIKSPNHILLDLSFQKVPCMKFSQRNGMFSWTLFPCPSWNVSFFPMSQILTKLLVTKDRKLFTRNLHNITTNHTFHISVGLQCLPLSLNMTLNFSPFYTSTAIQQLWD